MTDYKALCAELLDEIPYESPLTCIACAALAQPEPEGPTRRQLLQLAAEFWPEGCEPAQAVPYARAARSRWGRPVAEESSVAQPADSEVAEPVAWMYRGEPDFDGTAWRENWQVTTDRQLAVFKAQPSQPVPLVPVAQPADGEVAKLVAQLRSRHYGPGALDFAADLLSRLSPPQPVPVSEGLPAAEDCDAEGRCWFHSVGRTWKDWYLLRAASATETETHWLPAHSLPVPTSGEGKA